MAKRKYYVVWKGRKTGVFSTWDECKEQISNFTAAVYKSFESLAEAKKAYQSKPHLYVGQKKSSKNLSRAEIAAVGRPIKNSISVDAACSGNPGKLEYQGVETESSNHLFHMGPFPEGTVNLGEFLALVHGLAFLKKRKIDVPIYSDSVTAMKWVRDKKINTKLERSAKNEELFELVDRGIEWLKKNTYTNKIIKWDTAIWGEIPADFGRK
jgi:ribonuclease HI